MPFVTEGQLIAESETGDAWRRFIACVAEARASQTLAVAAPLIRTRGDAIIACLASGIARNEWEFNQIACMWKEHAVPSFANVDSDGFICVDRGDW